MDAIRIFPSVIKAGDTYKLEYALPQEPEGEQWARVDVDLRLATTKDRRTYNFFQTRPDGDTWGTAELTFPAAETAAMVDGVYRFRVYATSNGTPVSICTLSSGVVDVRDPMNPQTTHNERMVCLLEATLENKVDGRGDVIEYKIEGSRELKAMTLDQLYKTLDHYRDQLNYERGHRGSRVWFEAPYE